MRSEVGIAGEQRVDRRIERPRRIDQELDGKTVLRHVRRREGHLDAGKAVVGGRRDTRIGELPRRRVEGKPFRQVLARGELCRPRAFRLADRHEVCVVVDTG
ncbi:hypothetical protein FQZ97_807340 [compost metagenome]